MALGDKIVNLDGLKEVHDYFDGEIGDLKSALEKVSDIPIDIFQVTPNVDTTKSGTGWEFTYYTEPNKFAIYGSTGSNGFRITPFFGQDGNTTVGSNSPTKPIAPGTYTIIFDGTIDGTLGVRYTESTYNAGSAVNSGDTLVVGDGGGCLFISAEKNKTFGTESEPAIVTLHLYAGVTTGEPTAIDAVARNSISTTDAKVEKLRKYVSTSGNDTNDGNSFATAYATIGKAMSVTADEIYVATGTYTESTIAENQNYRHNGVKIICDHATLKPSGTGLQFRAANVEIIGLTVDLSDATNENSYGFLLLNCTGKLTDCVVFGAKGAGGFRLDGSRITLERCVAYDCDIDGFNGHTVDTGYETECTLINCVAHDCGDDGASIHESGKMYVIGGEYYNNVQVGVAPAQWCEFDIEGAYCHDNGHSGIAALNSSYTEGTKGKGKIFGCVSTGNGEYGVKVGNYVVIALSNALSGNTSGTYLQDTGGELTVFAPSAE